MSRRIGVEARGIRMPVIKQGDDLVDLVSRYLMEASASEYAPFPIRNRDVVGVTESLLARAQGNTVTLEDIALDVTNKMPEGDVAIAFPILSRNRFMPLLTGLIKGIRGRVLLFLSYPSDEVGNHLIEPAEYLKKSKSITEECFDEAVYETLFGSFPHPFTGVDYVKLYKSLDPERIDIRFTNNPLSILDYTTRVIVANIHGRELFASLLRERGANVLTLDQICSSPLRHGGGFNPDFGLLGSNYSKEGVVKLFPREAPRFVEALQKAIYECSGKNVEVLVYGDGAFKDPVCGIWELADPVVSPGYTSGLEGTPSEIKFKMIADNAEHDPHDAIREAILSKPASSGAEAGIKAVKNALGTTPRRYCDLLGSLCDLVSGSGDKGTPVIHISGYFDSYID